MTSYQPIGLTSAAINAASLAAEADGGGSVILPRGVFTVDEPVMLRPGVFIEGHRTATVLKASQAYAGAIVQSSTPPQGENFSRNLDLRRVTIIGNGRSAGCTGLSLMHAAETVLEEVRISECSLGFEFNDSIVTMMRCPKVYNNGVGGKVHNRSNVTTIIGGRIQASNAENLIIKGPNTYTVTVNGVAIESSGLAIPSPGVLVDSGVMGLTLSGNHLEANRNIDGGQVVIKNGTPPDGQSTVCIIGGWMTCASKSKYAVEAVECLNLTVVGMNTGGHQRTFCLGASTRANLTPGLVADINSGSAIYEGVEPYSLVHNGSLCINGSLSFTSDGTCQIAKTKTGNLNMATLPGMRIYINGQMFQG